MKVEISIIIPVYNASSYIHKCIESFFEQSFKNFEIIFIDDCSTDDSTSVIENYCKIDKRIRIIKLSKNSGPMVAREIGYKSALGDFIVFCDADDFMPAESLEHLYIKAKETNADIVSGDIELLYANGRTELWHSSLPYGNTRDAAIKATMLGDYRHNIVAKLFKRKLFVDNNYITIEGLKYFEDYWLMIQCINNVASVRHIDKVVYIYKQVETSSTHQSYSEVRVKSDILAHRMVYDLLINERDLSKYVISNCQRSLSRILSTEYPAGKLIREYGFDSIMTLTSLFRYNSMTAFIKMLLQSRVMNKIKCKK